MGTCFNADEIQMISDRLENTAAVIEFLGEAATCLADREEPLTSNALFGMSLAYQRTVAEVHDVMKIVCRRDQ